MTYMSTFRVVAYRSAGTWFARVQVTAGIGRGQGMDFLTAVQEALARIPGGRV